MKEPILFKNFEFKEQVGTEVKVAAHGSLHSFHQVKNQSGISEFHYEVAEGGALEAVLLQNIDVGLDSLVKIKVTAARDAKVKLTIIQEGASRSQVEIVSIANGAGSEVEIHGLQYAKNNQKFAFIAHAQHPVPHTRSDLQVWCMANDEAQSIFNGLITIEKGAHHTEAFQKNKNLLLSDRATIDTFPKLLIANHDVKCAHGSSVSQLEPDQFYYLESRGINAADAEKMLLNGFQNQAIDWIQNKENKMKIQKALGIFEEDFL